MESFLRGRLNVGRIKAREEGKRAEKKTARRRICYYIIMVIMDLQSFVKWKNSIKINKIEHSAATKEATWINADWLCQHQCHKTKTKLERGKQEMNTLYFYCVLCAEPNWQFRVSAYSFRCFAWLFFSACNAIPSFALNFLLTFLIWLATTERNVSVHYNIFNMMKSCMDLNWLLYCKIVEPTFRFQLK